MLVLLVPGVGMGASPVGAAAAAEVVGGRLTWYYAHRALFLLPLAGWLAERMAL